MRKGFCPDCGQYKFLTKHSEVGSHKPPYIGICRKCHNKRDGMKDQKNKINGKYQKGTKRVHKKGWRR